MSCQYQIDIIHITIGILFTTFQGYFPVLGGQKGISLYRSINGVEEKNSSQRYSGLCPSTSSKRRDQRWIGQTLK